MFNKVIAAIKSLVGLKGRFSKVNELWEVNSKYRDCSVVTEFLNDRQKRVEEYGEDFILTYVSEDRFPEDVVGKVSLRKANRVFQTAYVKIKCGIVYWVFDD